MTQDAVIRQLEVIGEAVRSVPSTTLERAPGIEWPRLVAMRNMLTHGYFEVDLNIVWDTVVNDLASLESAVQSLLEGGE